MGLTASNGLLADVQMMRIRVRVLKVSVMYLSNIRYAKIDLGWPFFPKGSEKTKAAKSNY
jgi:hypothetical protein